MNILSLHSQVVSGHVGNNAAVLPLQLMGFEVWAVPTVLYSNHPGHGTYTGSVTPADEISALIDGMEQRGRLGECHGVLTGYLGDSAQAATVADAVSRVRRQTPTAIICCDPILGDQGTGIYVRDGVPEAITKHLIPAANLATPNYFELEILTGTTIRTLTDALAAGHQLRSLGPDTVVCSSLQREDGPADEIETLLVTGAGAWIARNPKVPNPPNGTGDLLAALILGHTLRGAAPDQALAASVSTVHSIVAASSGRSDKELALIDAQSNVTAPQFSAKVEQVA